MALRRVPWILVVAAIIFGLWFFPYPLLQSHKPHFVSRVLLSEPLLKAIFSDYLAVDRIPGWQVTRIQSLENRVIFTLNPQGGTLTSLLAWSHQHHHQLKFTEKNFILIAELESPAARFALPFKENIQNVSLLWDRLSRVIPSENIVIGQENLHEDLKETNLNIKVDSISPDILDIIAKQLKNMPTKLQAIDLSVNNGYMSGIMYLRVIGS